MIQTATAWPLWGLEDSATGVCGKKSARVFVLEFWKISKKTNFGKNENFEF